MPELPYLSLVPAVVTILVAVIFRRVATALFAGIVAGAFVFAQFEITMWVALLYKYMFVAFTDIERLKIVFFLILIGALLAIIAASGGYEKFAEVVSKKINSARKSRLTTWILSFFLFFDDYANVLISGASMRNINEKNGVSRAFLAYIVDVVAIMASIMLISTWASFEGSTMVEAGKSIGENKSVTHYFLQAMPFHFYTFFAIALTLLAAYTGKWFGYKADKQTFTDKNENNIFDLSKLKFAHAVAPFLTLIGCAIGGLFIVGYYFLRKNGDELTLINILGNAPSIDILIVSTIIALTEIIIWLLKDKVVQPKNILKASTKGAVSMIDVCMVIIMATGLSAVSEDLETGRYIADSITQYLTPEILPVLIFVISMLITVATGFSWSSMAIVMPIAFQLAVSNQITDLIPAISAAVITGAVSGEHIIPFSEKCVMTSAACKISPMYHIKTQIFQSLTAFSAAAVGFLLLGFRFNYLLCILIPLALMVAVHFAFARENKSKSVA